MSIAPKKLLYLGLEPDMFFEISDQLRDRLNEMKAYMNRPDYKGDIDIERKYNYLKTILDCLDTQLTS